MALEEIRKRLREIVKSAWKEHREFREQLEDVWNTEMRREYKKALTESPDPIKALREAAEKYDLDEKYRQKWGAAPDSLIEKLYGVSDLWDEESRKKVRETVRSLDIHELYKLCMWGKYEEVAKRIGEKSVPRNFAECARLVAHAKKLSERLAEAWGK